MHACRLFCDPINRIAYASDPSNYMDGQVTSYDKDNQQLTVNVGQVNGSGTYSDWFIGLVPQGSPPSLDQLLDVGISGAVRNQALVWDGTRWVNKPSAAYVPNTSIAQISSDYTISEGDVYVLADASSADLTVQLTASSPGRVITIKKTDTSDNIVRLQPVSGTIDGESYFDIDTAYVAIKVIFDGNTWWVV